MSGTNPWGRCRECDRWFFIEHASQMDPHCPVCGTQPAEVVDRAEGSGHDEAAAEAAG